jgi:branched-chain amino acid transport system permease protein
MASTTGPTLGRRLRSRVLWAIVALYAVGGLLIWHTGADPLKYGQSFLFFLTPLLALAITLNLEAGYTGIPNFGKLLFVAGGASVSASVASYLSFQVLEVNLSKIACPYFHDYHSCQPYAISQVINPELSQNPTLSISLIVLMLVIGALVGLALGYIFSYPAIRLREDYLGMLLLAASQFYPIYLGSYNPVLDLINDTNGLNIPNLFGTLGGQTRIWAGIAIFGVLALGIYWFAERAARSPLGRMLRATRDDENASEALGKDTIATKRRMLMLASAMAGMVGAYYVINVGAVSADQWAGSAGRTYWTFWPWVMVVLGGLGNNLGVAFGAITFSFVYTAIDQVKITIGSVYFPIPNFSNFSVSYFPIDPSYIQYIVFGLLLVGILLLRPDGLIPEKSTHTLSGSRLARILRGGSPGPPEKEESNNSKTS